MTASPDLTDSLTCEVIRSEERFAALRQPWDSLVEEAAIEHPFVSHLWLQTWWESFSSGSDELCVILVWAGERLVGGGALHLREVRLAGIKMRALETLHNDHTPRAEFPVSCRHREVYALIWREISSMDVDLVLLKQFLDDSPVLHALRDSARRGEWLIGSWASSKSPFIPLESGHEQFLKQLKSKQRYNLLKRQSKLEKLGGLELEMLTSIDELDEGIAEGLRIEAAAWKAAAGTAIISDPQVEDFYTRFAKRAANMGLLRLAFLRVQGKRISFIYILGYLDTAYGLKMGYDPDFRKYAPGLTLLNLILKNTCSQGYTEFDLLGDDEVWKMMWTDQIRSHQWLYLFRPTLRGRTAHFLKFRLKPRLKALLRRNGP